MDLLTSFAKIIITTLILLIPILFICFFTFFGKKAYPLKKKVKSFSICMIVAGGTFLLFIGNLYFDSKNSSSTTETVADGFTINSYNVKLNVHENNVVDVEENITVDFYEEGHHGIYKFIPTWLEYTSQDGQTLSRNAKITNLQAIGDEFTTDTINGKKRVKIGSAESTLTPGLKKYTISYQYNMGEDPFINFDEFIFHAYGDFWGTKINNATLDITMPTNITNNAIKFFNDKYRQNDITANVSYYINGNTLHAQVLNYDLYKSLTVDIVLPEGYFAGAQNNYGTTSLLLLLLIIAITIFIFICWLKFGKDYHYSETVEFYAPEGYDSAAIGYIYKKDSGRKLAISLIVSLASQGIIRIDESEDKKTRTIVNLCSTDVNKAIERKIGITKLKSANGGPVKAKLDKYFGNENTAIITSDYDKFLSDSKSLIKNGYLKIDYDTIDDYSNEALENIKKQMKNKSKETLANLSTNERLVYDQLFRKSDENNLANDLDFYEVFSKINDNLQEKLDKKIDDTKSHIFKAICSGLFFLEIGYFLFAFNYYEDLNPKYNILYIIAIVSILISVVFIILMTRKSSYGSQIMAQIKGFKRYLETAEKDQLEGLVNQNPNYFYEILPYAYVLGVSKKWIEKFENIPMPSPDMGNFDYRDIDSYNDLADSISMPISSGSSSSACGGGCSSCGGGCSSCGGGGSW